MTRWIIPAPEWVERGENTFAYVSNGTRHGLIAQTAGRVWIVECAGDSARKLSQPEARAWVEARVMEAMGATPLDMPELSPADTVMTAEQIADRAWNEAIEAALNATKRVAEVSRELGDISSATALANVYERLLALKRGDGNE